MCGGTEWCTQPGNITISPGTTSGQLILQSADTTALTINNAHITASGNVSGSATSTGSFGKIILNYDKLQSSDPGIKGMIYRDASNNLKISAG